MPTQARHRCVARLRGHTSNARACVLSNKASEQSGAQVRCVAALPNGHVVSGSDDNTLMVWDMSTGQCRRTLRGHTRDARRRRPVEPRVDRSSTPRRAQVWCVAALPDGRVVSGSDDRTLKVWEDVEGKMARLLALRRTQKNFAGRLIAAFL